MVDYTRVPVSYMVGGVRRYLEAGIPPGSFLMALFSNDLKETYRRADSENMHAIPDWVRFMINEMPANSQGSPEKVQEWIRSFQDEETDDRYRPG